MLDNQKNIEALRRLLTYASHEASVMKNDRLSEIIATAIKEIDVHRLRWPGEPIIVEKLKKQQIV